MIELRVLRDWGHPSLDGPKPAFSCDTTCVKRGSVIIAWLRPRRGGYRVVTPNGDDLGVAATPAEAMLKAMRREERVKEARRLGVY